MTLTKKYNIWNKNFICVFIINFIICFVFYISTSSINDYATKVLRSSDSIAGLASGIFVIGALFSRLYFGSIIDTINIKKTMLISLVLYFISNSAYLFTNGVSSLILIRLFSGIFYGICSCGAGAVVARLVPSRKRGVGIGYYAISVVLSSAFGPFLAVYLASKGEFNTGFIISLVSIALSIIAAILLKVRNYKKHHHQAIKKGFSIYNYYEKSSISIGFVVFLLGFAYGGILVYMSSYTSYLDNLHSIDYKAYSFAGSLFFVIYASVSVFSRPIAGKIFDKMGANFILIPSIVFLFISLLLLANAYSPYMIFISAVFCALGYGNASSSAQSLTLKLCPPHKLGLANSSFFISLDFGIGLSPYVLGLIKPMLDFSAIYELCAGVIFIAFVFYFIFVMKKAK